MPTTTTAAPAPPPADSPAAPPLTVPRTISGVSKEQLAAMLKSSEDETAAAEEVERLRAARTKAEIGWQESHAKYLEFEKAAKAATQQVDELSAALRTVTVERNELNARLNEELATFAKSKEVIAGLKVTIRSLEGENQLKEDQHLAEVKALHKDIIQLRQENRALSLSDARAKMRTKERLFVEGAERIFRCLLSLQATSACPVCLEALEAPVVLVPCGHVMCSHCFRESNAQRGLRVVGDRDDLVFGPNTCLSLAAAAHDGATSSSAADGAAGPLQASPSRAHLLSSDASAGTFVLAASPMSEASRHLHQRLRTATSNGGVSHPERLEAAAHAAANALAKPSKVTGFYCDECAIFNCVRIVPCGRVQEVVESAKYVHRNMEEIRAGVVLQAAIVDGTVPETATAVDIKVKDSGEERLANARGTGGVDLEAGAEAFLLDDD